MSYMKIFYFILLLLISCSSLTNKSINNQIVDDINDPLLTNESYLRQLGLKFDFGYLPELYLKKIKDSQKDHYNWITFSPENIELSKNEFNFIESEIRKLPSQITNLVGNRLYFFTIVKNLGSSGLTIPILDKNSNTYRYVILIDEKVLKKNFCDFTSEKESTVYTSGNLKFSCTTSKPISGFLAIFLHELGHVLSAANNLVITSGVSITTDYGPNWYLFSRNSWNWDKKDFVVIKDTNIEKWSKIRKYYSQNQTDKLKNSDLVEDFRLLKTSNFPTFYSTQSPDEEWSEFFMITVLNDYLKIDLNFILMENDKKIDTLIPCQTGLCSSKKKLVRFFIENSELFPY